MGQMPPKTNTTIRIADEQLALADELIPAVSRDPALRASGRDVSRSTVLRIALDLGLAELQRRGGFARPTGDGAVKP